MVVTLGQQYNIGEKPAVKLYSIAMQGHQKNSENKNFVVHHQTWYNSNNVLLHRL